MNRRGLGKNRGKGYYNIVPMDKHIHSLSAKGVKTYNYKTPRGEVNVDVRDVPLGTATYYQTKSVNKTPLLDEVKTLALNFDMNQYAQAYFNEFDSSFVLYGNHGLKTQIAYFLSNVKAKTPAQKEAKERLLKLMKDKNLQAKADFSDVAKPLINRKIVKARQLTKQEVEEEGWNRSTTALVLDDGTLVYPSQDDEGNDSGALFGKMPDGEAVRFGIQSYLDLNAKKVLAKKKKDGIKVKKVIIHWKEGKQGYEKYPQEFSSIEEANKKIFSNSMNAPREGGYDKHSFTVIWEDGSEYTGRMDVKHPTQPNPDLDIREHIKDEARYLLNPRPEDKWTKPDKETKKFSKQLLDGTFQFNAKKGLKVGDKISTSDFKDGVVTAVHPYGYDVRVFSGNRIVGEKVVFKTDKVKKLNAMKQHTIGTFKTKKQAVSKLAWYKEHTHPTKIIKRKKGYSAVYYSQPD